MHSCERGRFGVVKLVQSATIAMSLDEPPRLREVVLRRFPRITRYFSVFRGSSEQPNPVKVNVEVPARPMGTSFVKRPPPRNRTLGSSRDRLRALQRHGRM